MNMRSVCETRIRATNNEMVSTSSLTFALESIWPLYFKIYTRQSNELKHKQIFVTPKWVSLGKGLTDSVLIFCGAIAIVPASIVSKINQHAIFTAK
jgi:hypothetical protein